MHVDACLRLLVLNKTNGNEIQKYIMRVERELILIMFVINQFRESCNPVCFAKHKDDCVAHIQGEVYKNI